MELFLDVVLDAVKDTAVLIPFLYITYVLMEALEHGARRWTERVVSGAGKAGPVVGALVGALPQCGFSAMGATLYAARVVTLGTLVAVILSTSDEMLPVFVANRAPVSQIASILIFKVVIAMVAGLLVDLAVRVFSIGKPQAPRIHDLCERDHCDCGSISPLGADEALAEEVLVDDGDLAEAEADLAHGCPTCGHGAHDHDHDHGCGACAHDHDHGHGSIWKSALIHTVQVTIFIFLVTLVLNLAIELVGTDVFADFLTGHPSMAVLAAALFGLIPNCAASVTISQLYLEGALGAGAMAAGLLVAGGVGLLVLLRTNRPVRQSVAILALLWAIAVLCGFIVNWSGFVF